MPDILTNKAGCLLQHGHANDRIYVMKTPEIVTASMISEIEQLRSEHHYSKICIKTGARWKELFLALGYEEEAAIPGYFQDPADDLIFYSKFFSSRRKKVPSEELKMVQANIETAKKRAADRLNCTLPEGYSIRALGQEDADALAALYKDVFPTYPFPIHDPLYIRETMDSHVYYFGVFSRDKLAAASSAETAPGQLAAEMTDFATYSDHTGKSLSLHLLQHMESVLTERNYRTAFTIARSASPPMNITFSRSGYLFGGTLFRNTNISGRIENMNIWYKGLQI